MSPNDSLRVRPGPFRTAFVAAAVLAAVPASALAAGPTDPVTFTEPPATGLPFIPGVRLISELPGEYVEEEYLASGAATLFNYANNPPQSPDDVVAVQNDVPYQTRIVVRRPANVEDFNGTVVVEWLNSTSGFDIAPAWDASAEYFTREGVVYVGVTNANQALAYLVGGCRLLGLLPPTCGTRYATLSLPEDGLAYEMLSQIANAFATGDGSPLPEDYEVDRLFHVGQSQQAGSVITYASAFHLDGVNDGYFIQAGIQARRLNDGIPCGADGAPAFPACTPQLPIPLVRTDLPVPVYQAITQTDFAPDGLGFSVFGRQPDTDNYRYYEIAGGGHNVVHIDIEVLPAGVFGPTPLFLEDLCLNEFNTTADGPVFSAYVLNALWQRMAEQTDYPDYANPPAGVVLDIDATGQLQTDQFGNVTGGVRLPSVEVPRATYLSSNIALPLPPPLDQFAALTCRLSGSTIPFSQEQLDALYPNQASYFLQVLVSTVRLKLQGLLLKEDALTILWRAVFTG